MLPHKIATPIAHDFVRSRPHLSLGPLTEIDRRAVMKLAADNDVPPEVLLREVEAEIDWLGHENPL